MKPGQSRKFAYNGGIQTLSLNPGEYYLQVYGAKGGDSSGSGKGASGGYSFGFIYLTIPTLLSIVVGGSGQNSTYGLQSNVPGGFNGGGYNYQDCNCNGGGSGGGATHIATAPGLLSSLVSKRETVLIVAGGGGGGGWKGNGGIGGGGNSCGGSGSFAAGGCPEGGYKFGQGNGGSPGTCSGAGDIHAAGAGSGFFGGDTYRSTDDSGGGGGSGFINILLLKKYGGISGINQGDGFANITCISVSDLVPTQKIHQEKVLNLKKRFFFLIFNSMNMPKIAVLFFFKDL